MLYADKAALENRTKVKLLAIRERELNHVLSRYDAIGTQAALLAGFAITSLTALSPTGPRPRLPRRLHPARRAPRRAGRGRAAA